MPALDYLNSKKYQSYPFIPGQASPIDAKAVVDAFFVVGSANEWSYTDTLRLYNVSISGSDYIFRFRGSVGDPPYFEFTVSGDSPEFTTFWVEASATEGGTTKTEWGFGFIQIGQLDGLNTGSYDLKVIPAKIQNMSDSQITSMRVANKHSTMFEDAACDGVGGGSSSSNNNNSLSGSSSGIGAGQPYKVNPTVLTGDLNFQPGQFITIDQSAFRRTLTVSTVNNPVLGGELPCADKRVFPDSYDPSIEPSCKDLVYSINGIGPSPDSNTFVMAGSRGVVVSQDLSDPNALRITFYPLLLLTPAEESDVCSTDP